MQKWRMKHMQESTLKKLLSPSYIAHKVKWSFYRNKFKSIGKGCSMGKGFVLLGCKNISFGNNVLCGNNVKLETWDAYCGKPTGYTPSLVIGNNVSITEGTFISCVNCILIDDGTLIGTGTFICDNYHGRNTTDELLIPPSQRKLWSKGPVTIGKNVWIGRNVSIMPEVHIGDGAVIGANAVVTHDIPENCVAVGIPAKVIKIIK